MTDINEQRNLLSESVAKLFRDMMADGLPESDAAALAQGQLPAALWRRVEQHGIVATLVPESAGGFGGNWLDACVVLGHAGYHAVPLPIAETLLAQRLLVEAGIDLPEGAIAIAAEAGAQLRRDGDGWRLDGHASAVPWGNAAPHCAVVCHHQGGMHIALVAANAITAMDNSCTVAREPVADLHFNNSPVRAAGACKSDVFALCTLLRVAQIGGALNRALHQSVQYANERNQFGKPIAKFQAIQHSLALLADEAAAVNCAALAACRAANLGDAGFEIAAAKLRANRAIGAATSIAHQVHGAIGFTREHTLHRVTQRLWSWRSQFGNDRFWAMQLGSMVAQRGARNLWPDLTGRSDRS